MREASRPPRAAAADRQVPVRQWVISVPKRLRGFLADRPRAVAALTKIFLTEIEQHLLAASGGATRAPSPHAPRQVHLQPRKQHPGRLR
jgi:hypothetical protein